MLTCIVSFMRQLIHEQGVELMTLKKKKNSSARSLTPFETLKECVPLFKR